MGEQYKVEDVLKTKIENGQTFYRIKWVNYPAWQNTWEPKNHLPQDVIDYYNQKQKELQEKKQQKALLKQTRNRLEQVPSDFKILSHFMSAEGQLTFRVLFAGKKKQLSREEVVTRNGRLLCQYYIQLARRKNKY